MVRIKHRYLSLNILYPESKTFNYAPNTPNFLKFHTPTPRHVNNKSFIDHLRSHIVALFGDQGLGLCLSSLKIVYFSNATSTIILRVPRSHHQIVWASLSYMTHLPTPRERNATAPKCVIRVVHVSGTIRKAEEDLLRRNRQYIVRAKSAGMDLTDSILSTLAGGGDADVPSKDNNQQDSGFLMEDAEDDSDSE